MKIRKATKEDLNCISNLFLKESSKKPYSQGYNPITIKKRVENMFNFGDIYLAIVDGTLSGFISVAGDEKNEIYIDEFWILEEFQRQGIGSKLLDFVQKKYKKKGARTISVMTSRTAGAFKFYKKFKFKEDKEDVILKKKIE